MSASSNWSVELIYMVIKPVVDVIIHLWELMHMVSTSEAEPLIRASVAAAEHLN